METDKCYRIDCSQTNGGYDGLFDELRYELMENGYVKVKCENLIDGDCDRACLDVIESVGGICCPYNDDPDALI